MIRTRIERQTAAGFISAFSGLASLQIALHSTMIITVSINAFFFFFACLLRERDGRAGATKRKTFYVWRSRKAGGMLCRTESECLQVHFENVRPFPPFNVAWNRNRISSLWRNVTGSLGLFVLASFFSIGSRRRRLSTGAHALFRACCVEALVHLFPETRDGLHPPWTLRSNVGPSCRIDRDRHITAFVAVESFSSPTAAISVKTMARLESGCTGRRSCQSWHTLRYDVLTQGFQNFSTPWPPK